MRSILAACLLGVVATVLLVAPGEAGEVKCSCRQISAEGKGNTSCSAGEAGGKCTIDYNLFDNRETAAFQLLVGAGVLVQGRIRPNSGPTGEVLRNQPDDDRLADAIILYLGVALANLGISGGSLDDAAKELGAAIRQARREIAPLFRTSRIGDPLAPASGPSSLAARPLVGGPPMRVDEGCVEVMLSGGVWLMFKALGSPVALLPFCADNRL